MRTFLLALSASMLAMLSLSVPGQAKDPISVIIDRAKVMRLPFPADSIVIGNPGIADVTVHDKVTLILTGKMAGITNLVILDAKGNPIADEVITVQKIQEGLVTVQRGNTRQSYFCTPHCNSMLEVGDSTDFFGTASSQLQMRNSLGQQTTSTPQQ